MIVNSPAKINWFLYVLGKRDDDFHEIVSSIQKVALFDSLSFELTDRIQLHDDSNISDNIVLKTIEVLKRYGPECERGVSIKLNKNIPIAAGLGGGSGNAASTIIELNRLWSLGLSREELFGAASEIGSDVPFFLGNSFSIASGRGERLEAYDIDQQYDILLVNPGIEISARWAYENISSYTDLEHVENSIEEFVRALKGRDYKVLDEFMCNDLEGAVFNEYPEIREIKEKIMRDGARLSLMSGSGSTVFGLFEDEDSAENARSHFNGIWTAIVKTMR